MAMLQKLVLSLRHWFTRSGHPKPVDLESPLESAADDAEVLLAFAAQSRRSLDEKLIAELTERRAKVVEHFQSGTPLLPAERAAFWYAYDKLAVAMSPLSAHSIRSSMRVNAKHMLAALLTIPAWLAIIGTIVFLFSIGVQGFWVAGRELMDQADKGESARAALSKQIAELDSAQLQTDRKIQANKAKQLCLRKGWCEANPESFGLALKKDRTSSDQKKELERLETQFETFKEEGGEREIKIESLKVQQKDLTDAGTAPTELLRSWRQRMGILCNIPLFKTMCISDASAAEGEVKKAQDNLDAARKALRNHSSAVSDKASACLANAKEKGRVPTRFLSLYCGDTDEQNLQREIDSATYALLRAEDKLQRRTVTEVRIMLGNLATYIVPLGMGLLGALAFMMQMLTTQLREHTYVPVSASWSIVRLCLGAIAGVFGGLATPQSDAVLKALPPLFIPFVFGYGIEILFALLNRIVGTFTDKSLPPKSL